MQLVLIVFFGVLSLAFICISLHYRKLFQRSVLCIDKMVDSAVKDRDAMEGFVEKIKELRKSFNDLNLKYDENDHRLNLENGQLATELEYYKSALEFTKSENRKLSCQNSSLRAKLKKIQKQVKYAFAPDDKLASFYTIRHIVKN